MRNRSSVVIVENNMVALIRRERNGKVYYVFPGGGIKENEKPEDAARREALEELGVIVKVEECIAQVEFNGNQYFFLSEIVGGEFGTGQGEEFTDKYKDRGTYLPVWIGIEKMLSMDVKPQEVALKIQSLYM
ncbi:NUDIX hydrolase [Lysinibacillus cavernae]|uniref:NUDIX hydrolase n=1 Tax=Lysinibacillus cavernae TaxID=2666135 RepID=UPI0012D96440|nr:NUDIX domain-containing protein [Lysinibacillus cavernae]